MNLMENQKSISTLKHARKYAATTRTTAVTAGAVQLNLTSMSARKKNKMQRQIAVVGVVVAII